MTFVVGKVGEVAPGNLAVCSVEGQRVVVANVNGTHYAFVDWCTHLGCPLSTGALEGTTITCACHGSQFDITTGAVVSGPARVAIDVYGLEEVDGELRLRFGAAEEEAPAPAAPAPAALKEEPKPAAPVRARAQRQPIEGVLARVALFAGLEKDTLEALEAFTFRRRFAPGELIVEEGRTGNGLYVVLSGQVEVIKGLGTDRQQTVAVLGPGEPFGEMAVLGEWPRTASVRAIDAVECLGMDRWVFLAQLNREPQLAIKMLQVVVQRLAETDRKLMEKV